MCQLRLDFITFRLSGPSLLSSPFGHCLNDRLAIFSSQHPKLGLSEGNLICGDMTDQHSKEPSIKDILQGITTQSVQV